MTPAPLAIKAKKITSVKKLFSQLFFISLILSIDINFASNVYAKGLTSLSTGIHNNKIINLLHQADKNRRSNPLFFEQILSEISKKKSNLSTQETHYYTFLLGYFHTYRGQYSKAEEHLQAVIESNADGLIKHRANHTLIGLLAAQKKWGEGLQNLAVNISYLPQLPKGEHYNNALLIVVQFYNQLKQYNLSLNYINLLKKESLSTKNECLLKQLSYEAKFYLRELKLKGDKIDRAIEQCESSTSKMLPNIIRLYKAKLYLQIDQPIQASDLLLVNKASVESTHYPMLIAEFNNTLAKAYWQQGDISNSKAHTNKALQVNLNGSNVEQAADTYKLLFQIAKSEKNHQLALEYHEQYAELDKANLDETKAKYLAFQLAEHQAFEQESQIKLLNEQNNALAAEQALAKTQANNRKLIILLLALIILVFAFFGARLWRTHKRVRQLAEYDPLTGIFNRGHFTQVTNSALKYCQNAEQDLSLIMFDLDHFKKVNDTFGHACGDWALKETIKVCKDIGRQNDIFARLGGEEFCLVLPSCNIDAAMLRAEACRAAIEAIITEESKHDFTITASFGVTDVKRSGFNLDKLLADADMAAYDSKHSGRNRVTIHQVPEKKVEPLDNSWSL